MGSSLNGSSNGSSRSGAWAHAAANLRSFLDPNQPGFLILFVSNLCNFLCDFCFLTEESRKGEGMENDLSLEELRKISKTVGPLVQFSMTGGEPFLRKDLADIAEAFLTECRPRYMSMPTNAWFPERIVPYLERVVPQFPRTNMRLLFSIDGIGEEHDRLRSKPGSYARILESYRVVSPLRKKFPNLVLDANCVFTANNENNLPNTLKTLQTEFEFDNITLAYARGEISNPELKKSAFEKYEALHEQLKNWKRGKENRLLYPVWRAVADVSRDHLVRVVGNDEFVIPCVAGRKLVEIYPNGDVFPCETLGKKLGNLREFEYDLQRLLASPESRALTKWIVDSQCKCSFECALSASVVWNAKAYPKLAKAAIRNIGAKPGGRPSPPRLGNCASGGGGEDGRKD